MGWEKVQNHPRFKVQLAVRGILRSSQEDDDRNPDAPAIVTQTHDLSASGLSLFVPSLPFVFAYLLSPDNTIQLKLELPSGIVSLVTTLIHDRPITERGAFPGYVITGLAERGAVLESLSFTARDAINYAWLIGVKIKDMSESDREKYLAFVNSLQ